MDNYLVLENIYKIFPPRGGIGEVTAVDDVSLTIKKGELWTFLGPSGCGKTTTLRMIAGFEFPTKGNIMLDGQNVNTLPPHKRDMSMVFQSYAIFPHLSVFENVAYGLRVSRRPKAEIDERVNRVLALVELDGFGKRAPNQLSGGQQQRVALARALVMEPKVLLMDEPLSNLDAKLREQMRSEIRRIQQLMGITSVYVTHDQAEAMTISDKVVIMDNGRIAQIGTPTEIYRQPVSRFVADFIGRANFLTATVKEVSAETLTVSVMDQVLQLAKPARDFHAGQTVTIVIRPEMAVIDNENPHFPGTVKQAAFLGSHIEYEIDVNGEHLAIVDTNPRHISVHQPGQKIGVRLIDECLVVLPEGA